MGQGETEEEKPRKRSDMQAERGNHASFLLASSAPQFPDLLNCVVTTTEHGVCTNSRLNYLRQAADNQKPTKPKPKPKPKKQRNNPGLFGP